MRAVRRSLPQLKRSWYILAFQPPLLGEAWLRALGPRRLLRSTSAPGTFTDADLAVYAKAWAEPGALTAMLNYYRANLLHPPSSAKARITTPTLILWGTNDLALGTELIAPTMDTCDNAELIELHGVSHWSPAEAAPAFNAALLAHLEVHGGVDPLVYKLMPAEVWASTPKPWVGSDDDLRDGFIHLSARAQVPGTLKAHFAEAGELVALAVDPVRLPAGALRWEKSRSGKRFPHLYAPLSLDAVVATHAIAKVDSDHVLPESW